MQPGQVPEQIVTTEPRAEREQERPDGEEAGGVGSIRGWNWGREEPLAGARDLDDRMEVLVERREEGAVLDVLPDDFAHHLCRE